MSARLLRRDPVTGGWTTPDGRFTVVVREEVPRNASRYLVHDTHGRARWTSPLIPGGNSQTVVTGLAAVRALIAAQLDEESHAH